MKNQLEHIIKACLQRDYNAQRALYDLFVDRLYFTVKRYINDSYYIENILQDVFLKVFTKLESYDSEKAAFNTWITTITIRESLNHLRKKNINFSKLTPQLENLGGSIDSTLVKMEIEDILTLIKRIPIKYQVVFNLYEIDGYDHNEIAQITGMASGTSRSYLTRAKKLIQDEIITMTDEI